MLPFLKPKGWPTLRKMSGESRYGFSEDDDLIEHSLDELLEAIQAKDHKGVIESLKSLIHTIKNQESEHASIHEEA